MEKTSYQYGQDAYRNGKPCIPALDQAFLSAKLAHKKIGEGLRDLKAWQKGWIDESLKD